MEKKWDNRKMITIRNQKGNIQQKIQILNTYNKRKL